MRVLATSLFAALTLMGIPVSCQITLNSYLPNFKDPYSGKKFNTLLDIDLQTGCVSNLQVTVTIPKISSKTQNNGNFVGGPFNNLLVEGTSAWSGPSGNGPATASVSWDGNNKLTFSNFIAGQSSGPGSKDRPGDKWINLNFDIPDVDFITKALPLTLQFNSDYTPVDEFDQPFINLNDPDLFQAVAASERCGDNPPGGSGDPIFSGFQGQQFQFHGLPDEHFNLVSSPDVQLNSHFVYLSSGKCDYNDTECFTHPGTYMDVLGLSVADAHVKMVAGTHEAGLRVWINDMEVPRGTHIKALSSNMTSSLRYHHNGIVEIATDLIGLEVINSDMFMNVRAALNNQQLLRVGATKHTVTDHAICKTNTETHNHQLVESTVAKKYPVTTQLHGLIGQTWRNVLVCGRNWMGTVQDYMVSDLFASDNHYNYFKW